MKKLRDPFVLLIVIFAFAISLVLFERAVGLTSPWLSLLAMCSVLGSLAFARPVFLPRLPHFLRRLRAWETSGRTYKALGVPAYGALLRRTPLRYLNAHVYLNRGPGDAAVVRDEIEAAEAAHFWAAATIVPYTVFACVENRWGVVASFMAVQIGANLYPILHLRWVRARLNRVLARKHSSHTRHV